MQKYEDNIATQLDGGALVPMSGVTVSVIDQSINKPAALYSDNGVTPITAPIVTDDLGHFAFFAADGRYTINFSSPRIVTFSRDVILEDPKDNPYATLAQLAAPTGSVNIGNGTETVADSFNALQLADYTALRAYTGPRKSVNVAGYLVSSAPSGISGMFVRDDSDTTSSDNGGTVIVASNGKRWKRQFNGFCLPTWFGAIGDNGVTNCTDPIRAAIKNSLSIEIPEGTFVCAPTATSGDTLLYLGTNAGYQTQRDGLTIRGHGDSSIIKLADNAGAAKMLFGLGITDTIKNITFKDLCFDLNGLNNLQVNIGDPLRYNCALYAMCYHENITFDNVTFLNGSGHQLVRAGGDTSATYGKNFRFINCRIKNFGIAITGNNVPDTSAVYVQADGIHIQGGSVSCDVFTFNSSKGHTAFELHGDNCTGVDGVSFENVQVPWLLASSQKPTKNATISNNKYSECLYMGSLDPSTYDQTVIDIGPGNIFNSTKTTSAIIHVGMSGETSKVRDNVRIFGNQIMLWGNANQGTPLVSLDSVYMKKLDIFDNSLGGLNGSAVYCAGIVMNSGELRIGVRDNRMDSLGATGGTYPNSPAFVHIETSSGSLAALTVSGNEFDNTAGKNYSAFGIVKLSGPINYLYLKGNKNHIDSTYPLTTGTPTVTYKDIERNYPAVWQEPLYESGFSPVTTAAPVTVADFSGYANNDYAAFRITIFSTDGGASNNGMTDYDVLVCGSGNVATRLANGGAYATDITLQFSGNVLRVQNANASTLYVKAVIRGTASKPVTFEI